MARTSLIALVAGVLFGLGLAVSGMFDPAKVLGFLDIAAIAGGGWDPSLAFVMAGGLAVTLPAFQVARRWRQPAAAAEFQTPQARGLDARLLSGALLFGIGWGLAGYCPGPALAALAFAVPGTLVFVVAMAAGMLVHALVVRR
ncbi:MAG TPA: hypothetical protein PLL72_25000 [Burkholderiaceae bacterium]|nr:hypothetical protein [Burkholderiaceae bacterium]